MCAIETTCSHVKRYEFHLVKTASIILLMMFFVMGPMAFGAVPAKNIGNTALLKEALKVQMPFIVNQGQVADTQVLYYATTMGGTVYIKENGEIVYFFPGSDASRGGILQENLVNGLKTRPVGSDTSRAKVNYFIGKDKHQWKINLKTYHSVLVGEVYKDIDLHLKAYGKTVEKIFTVQPGADPTQIQLSLAGSDALTVLKTGELEVLTGKDTIRFSNPIAYQMPDGQRKNIPVAYQLAGNNYSFNLGPYDASLPLIIDPCLSFSTFIGGSDDDKAFSIAVDIDGNAYIAGSTYSASFTHPSSPNDDFNNGDYDAFVVKLDPANPDPVIYYTFIGGRLYDAIYGIAVDSGYAYVTGETKSKDFPGTNGFYDKKIGGNTDAFVAKLGEDGSSLAYATYLGGGGPDRGYAIAVDAGCAYVTGETLSSNFPVTPGVVFAKSKGGVDGFVTKLDSSGEFLSYSTFFGGGGDDICRGIVVRDGKAYVTGQTSSSNLTTKPADVLDPTLGGTTDAFVVKFNDAGTEIDYLTYLGGNGVDIGNGIAVTDTNDVYITGETTAPSFSYSSEPIEIVGPLGGSDVFTVLLNATGTRIDFQAFIGGSGLDIAHDIVVDSSDIFIVGETDSDDFPLTGSDGDLNDGADQISSDGFIVRLNPDPSIVEETLVFSSYVGGDFNDVIRGVSIKSLPNVVCERPEEMVTRIYMAGYSDSTEAVDSDAVFGVVVDSDNDGETDEFDNCVCEPNADQANSDTDFLGDACDNCDDVDNELEEYQTGNSMKVGNQECAVTVFGMSPSDYWQPDYDCDGIGDACDDDDDNDGLPDWWEEKFFGDPVSTFGPDDDPDEEGLDNQEEFEDYESSNTKQGPDPNDPDTDDDGWNDKWEAQAGTSSIDSTSYPDNTIFQEGIFVDRVGGDDINLGAKIGTDFYPVKSIHAAVKRLNFLEPGIDTIKIKFITTGTYSIGDPEPDLPLEIHQNVIFEATGVTIDGTGAGNWKQGMVFSPMVDDMIIQGMDVVGFQEGLVFNTDGGCATLDNTRVFSQDVGLRLLDNFQLEIKFTNDSKIIGGRTGIVFEGESSNNTLINDTAVDSVVIENSDIGIGIKGGTDNTIVDFNIVGVPSGGVHGLVFYPGAEKFTMRGGLIEAFEVGVGFKADGVCLTLEGATIQSCRAGIEFLENYMNHVNMLGVLDDDTMITACDAGILFRAGSSNNLISHGRLMGNDAGIVFESCPDSIETPDDNQIVGTKIIDNTHYGVAILDGDGNQLIDLAINGSETGVYIGNNGSNNLVRGGSISGNFHQNFMVDGSQNIVKDIIIQASGETGIGNISGNTTLSGLTINGNATAVYGMIVEAPGKIVLDNVIIQDFDIGVSFSMDAACLRLNGSTIQNCGIGIDIREKYLLDIDLGDSQIMNCNVGIEVAAGSSNNTVRNGTISLNTLDGILVEGCSESPDENSFINIDIKSNDRHGVAFLGGLGNRIEGCTVSNNNEGTSADGFGGVAILDGSADVLRSIIFNNGCHGVYVDEAAGVDIIGNLIFGNPEGIRVGFVSDVTISSNTVTKNTSGLVLEDGALPHVAYNILYGNGLPGVPVDIYLEGAFDPANLIENNIGLVNQIDLPPTNISVDPRFSDPDDPDNPDFTLKYTSACIDATSMMEPGIDLNGAVRPKGFSWDMGAFEISSFKDEDEDGMPDSWELKFVDNIYDFLPDGHADSDGISNLDEFNEGSDPTVPVYISVTEPSNNPHFSNADSLSLEIFSVNADTVGVSTGDAVIDNGDGTWRSSITLADGSNVILVTADGTVDDQLYQAKDSLTVVRESAFPTIAIISPTTGGTYSTALESITISGFASDDTAIDILTWSNGTTTGTAEGTTSWTTGPIELNEGPNSIQIEARDIFGNYSFEDIEVTRQAAESIENVEQDLSVGHTSNVADEIDTDGDLFANDDEIACGSDPDDDADTPALYSYSEDYKYKNGEKIGLYIPDCLNLDIDGDGLPNWWEEQYFPGAPLADTAGDDGDGDLCNNLCEYERGTAPTTPQTIAFALEVVGAFDDLGNPYDYDPLTWLPKFGHTLEIQATWNPDYGALPAQAVFSLKQTSSHPGRAVNDPDPADLNGNEAYPDWYYEEAQGIDRFHGPDFGLTGAPQSGPGNCGGEDCFGQGKVFKSPVGNSYIVFLHAWDFGGRTNLVVTDDGAGNNIGQTWLPLGSHKNGIGDAWICTEFNDDGSCDSDKVVDPTALDPNADIDAIIFKNQGAYTAPPGDGFSNFEEYRGILYTDAELMDPDTLKPVLKHLRLNPFRKDLFVRAQGFWDAEGNPYDLVNQFESNSFRLGKAFLNAGIDVHNTTGWGHDATEDGSFYVYHSLGTVESVTAKDKIIQGTAGTTSWSATWPKHEWEFKLDSHYDANNPDAYWTPVGYWNVSGYELALDFEYPLSGSGTYKIRKPMPHINILIVRSDPTGTYGGQDGSIQFISATPPSPQNPLGTRYWRWSTKGYAWCQTTSNQESMYGLAVTLESPLENYFNDKPYKDGSTWNFPGWSITSTDGKLNPLNVVEDQSDQMDPIDGIMGDSANGNWDGDQRLANYSGDLNPFDIDGDGKVELPVASDPDDDDILNDINEYDSDEVLVHTITHEVGHALAGPMHTNDPECLMYKYSNNWDRAGNLSDIYRSLLRIHNITR
ncbi:MAG: hypothetical protein DRI24_07300 [Deltaproteobacteria bacterium]|nr:MAG: hypothetical protein DRI24_07300 [Deltaproteobacteria bacterium]